MYIVMVSSCNALFSLQQTTPYLCLIHFLFVTDLMYMLYMKLNLIRMHYIFQVTGSPLRHEIAIILFYGFHSAHFKAISLCMCLRFCTLQLQLIISNSSKINICFCIRKKTRKNRISFLRTSVGTSITFYLEQFYLNIQVILI